MASQKMQIYRGERGGRGGNPFNTKDFLRDLRGGKVLFATSLIFDFDQIRCQLPDFGVLHDEKVTEHGVEETAAPSGGADGTLGDHHIVFLGQARDLYLGAADKSRILDFPVKGIFARQVKGAGHEPFDIIGQARQNLAMIASGEAFHVFLYGLFVLAHGFIPRRGRSPE
jgi:hypothetical protein